MNLASLVASALMASALGLINSSPQANPRTDSEPLRASFVVAAESAIDAASAVNLKGEDAEFNPQMQALKSANANLAQMAQSDDERGVVSDLNDLTFAVSACHIVAKGGASTKECEGQINDDRTHAMQDLKQHKNGAAWVDGPPQ